MFTTNSDIGDSGNHSYTKSDSSRNYLTNTRIMELHKLQEDDWNQRSDGAKNGVSWITITVLKRILPIKDFRIEQLGDVD